MVGIPGMWEVYHGGYLRVYARYTMVGIHPCVYASLHHPGYTTVPTSPVLIHLRGAPVRDSKALGSALRLIIEKEPLRRNRPLFLLLLVGDEAQSYSGSPVGLITKIGCDKGLLPAITVGLVTLRRVLLFLLPSLISNEAKSAPRSS